MIGLVNVTGCQEQDYSLHGSVLPYATGILTGYLRDQGYRVKHFDFAPQIPRTILQGLTNHSFNSWLIRNKKTLQMEKFLICALREMPWLGQIKLLGLSVMSRANFPLALSLAKEIKNLYPDLYICMGGAYITLRTVVLPAYVDCFIKGPGEQPLAELVRYVNKETGFPEKCAGLWFRKNDKLINNQYAYRQIEQENLADYSDLDLSRYTVERKDHGCLLVVPYRMSRGCVHKCYFCAGRSMAEFESKSIEKIIAELAALRKLAENVYVLFCDASVNVESEKLAIVLDQIQERKLNLFWGGFLETKSLNIDLFRKMIVNGARYLIWAIESVTPDVAKSYEKFAEPELIEKILELGNDFGVKFLLLMMFDSPYEPHRVYKDFEQFVVKYRFYPNVAFFIQAMHVMPGSLLSENPENYEIKSVALRPKKNTWEEMADIKFDWYEKNESLFIHRMKFIYKRYRILMITDRYSSEQFCIQANFRHISIRLVVFAIFHIGHVCLLGLAIGPYILGRGNLSKLKI